MWIRLSVWHALDHYCLHTVGPRRRRFLNHENRRRFVGNNKSGSVSYEIWRREGDEGEWMLRMSTTKQRFTEFGVTPGRYYEYKIRAVATTNTSGFSNSAVVYGF